MAAWKEDIKKTRSRLWRSVDMTYVKGCLVGLLVVEALCPLIGLMKLGYRENFWTVELIIGGIVAAPILLFSLWRTRQIFRCAEGYTFSRAKLCCPHYSYLWKAMAFTVVVEDMEGNTFPANTRPIFHTHGFIPPVMEDYVDANVTIGYNEETGNIVVIG